MAGLNEMIHNELAELNNRLSRQNEEISFLKKAVVESERQRLHASRQEMASNVIITGLPEGESETDGELLEKVDSIFKTVNVENVSVNDCKLSRVGRPNGHRAIKIVTPSHEKRNLLLSKASTLRNNAGLRHVYINADRSFNFSTVRRPRGFLIGSSCSWSAECPLDLQLVVLRVNLTFSIWTFLELLKRGFPMILMRPFVKYVALITSLCV